MLFYFRRLLSSINRYALRSHNCGELCLKNEGENVKLYGWVAYKRMNKFVVLKDSFGMTQLKINESNEKIVDIVKNLTPESCIYVEGVVENRNKNKNLDMKTGEVEVLVKSLNVLNAAPKNLPINIKTDSQEQTKLKYRYLDIRSQYMQNNLRLRSEVTNKIRKFLCDDASFVEVETPTLFRRTPGGADEFVVPAGGLNKGKFYSLPQSPQQFKQLLMIGGIDKYFQIARCYRDEGAKQDRQPEFTQVDVELSFTDQDKVIELIEDMIKSSWPESMNEVKSKINFKRLLYDDAITKYGTDKPDLRIPWIIEDVSYLLKDIFKCKFVQCFIARDTCLHTSTSNKNRWKKLMEINQYCEKFDFFKVNKNKWINDKIKETLCKKFNINENDTLVLSWGNNIKAIQWTLGQLRNHIGEASGIRSSEGFEFCWITDFPLFEKSDNGKYVSSHHPFTAPKECDLQKLINMENLSSIKALHYDLVINGVEVGGGSIRIHDASIQKHVLENILEEPYDQLQHLIDALECGAPPHGGFALGLDRYIALLVGKGNSNVSIRDVIAFPKSKGGRCPMVNAPVTPDENILNRYGISIVKDS
uniref:AA_TRNA_LIGASE_II domain-containing protein n=1 Tax=Parastrongyloides trichosuri TaxID=131310 RepID=A0A0N4ZSP0_PARTI